MCSPLTNPINGHVEINGNTTGSTATYTCVTGYALSGLNSQERICGADGNWSFSEPLCKSTS